MKKITLYAMLTIAALAFCSPTAVAESKKSKESKGWRPTRTNRVQREGYGIYLGVTPFYDISPRRHRFCPHILPHFHIGNHHPRYHHRGNVALPNYGVGVGVGIRYGVFRSRNLGFGIHIR
jgi:hypothetical protein